MAATESIPGVEIVRGVVEAFSGKGVVLSTDTVSADAFRCPAECRWQSREREWILYTVNVAGFPRWLAARVALLVTFEYDGCNVHNARFRFSSKTLNRWYNDSAKYEVTARGAVSRIKGNSGCKACCSESMCVEFDVQLARSWDWVRTAVDSWRVRICGDGSVTIE